jgi:hypothetical protein
MVVLSPLRVTFDEPSAYSAVLARLGIRGGAVPVIAELFQPNFDISVVRRIFSAAVGLWLETAPRRNNVHNFRLASLDFSEKS